MRKYLIASVAVLATTVLASCGSSGSDGADVEEATTTTVVETTTTTEVEAVAVDEWAEGFCGNYATWTEAIATASQEVGEGVVAGDVASGRTAVEGLYESASAATQTLIGQIEAGGTPDVDDGDQLVDDLIAGFEAFDAAAQDAKAEIAALPDDADAFKVGRDEVGVAFQAEVETVADQLTALGTDYPSDDLDAAINASCT